MRAALIMALGALLAGCGTYYTSMDQMDRQDRCMMQHTWDTTIISGYGIQGCASTPWYNERRQKDARK